MSYDVSAPAGYMISDDQRRLDMDVVYHFLSTQAYWALGRSRKLCARSFLNCICFGLYAPDGSQVGFARVLSGRATSAHLADVFALPAHRGRGLGRVLVGAALVHPELTTVGRGTLQTNDAHAFYAAFGFGPLVKPEAQMERLGPPPLRQSLAPS
jgi:GNAT superfamily N-acetyltransferase